MAFRVHVSLFFANLSFHWTFMMLLISFSKFLAIYPWSTYTCFFNAIVPLLFKYMKLDFFSTLFLSSKLQNPLVYYNITKTKHMICDTFTSTFDSSLKKNAQVGRISSMKFPTSFLFEMKFFHK